MVYQGFEGEMIVDAKRYEDLVYAFGETTATLDARGTCCSSKSRPELAGRSSAFLGRLAHP
jgi:hypothetical protein